jgi:hypothetical protein
MPISSNKDIVGSQAEQKTNSHQITGKKRERLSGDNSGGGVKRRQFSYRLRTYTSLDESSIPGP